MAKVACIIGKDFEDSEFRKPYDAMKNAGHEVVLIGKKAGESVEGKQGKEKVKVEQSIDDARVGDYDLLFIPGGHSPDNLRADERFVKFVKEFDDSGKEIAAICHGAQLLMTAGIVEGRTLTAWKTVQKDLALIPNVNVRDEPVVRDANWITSRQPDDLDAFSNAILEDLKGGRTGRGQERGAGLQA